MGSPEELARWYATCEFSSVQLPLEYPPESIYSPFPVKILLIPPEDIATHEDTDPNEVLRTRKGIEEGGWQRRPVAVAGTSDDTLYDRLPTGVFIPKQPLPKYLFGILDGHHRREASVGFFSVIPAQLFPLDSPFFIIGTWRDGEPLLTTGDVRAIFQSQENASSKATKFQVVGKDGELRRIRDIQPTLVWHENDFVLP